MAGFESSVAGSASESGDTPLAGFDGTGRRPQLPGARTGTPASFKWAAAVSRRTPVSFSMRRNGHPSRPSAITCCRFSSFKTLLTSTEGSPLSLPCLDTFSLAGFQTSLIGRFWVSPKAIKAEPLITLRSWLRTSYLMTLELSALSPRGPSQQSDFTRR